MTGEYMGNYGAPRGFNFDVLAEDNDRIQPDTELEGYNLPAWVDKAVAAAQSQAIPTSAAHSNSTDVDRMKDRRKRKGSHTSVANRVFQALALSQSLVQTLFGVGMVL